MILAVSRENLNIEVCRSVEYRGCRGHCLLRVDPPHFTPEGNAIAQIKFDILPIFHLFLVSYIDIVVFISMEY
jgi:hypothetical protein